MLQGRTRAEILVFHKRSGTAAHEEHVANRKEYMLWTIFVILLVLWLLGLVSSYTMGGFIHILLVIAIVVLIIQLIQGRRPL
ncbi:MAG: lmo0937 family membrane protein [Candidatus Udaeobacter sp.]